jgi:hypothetical protein
MSGRESKIPALSQIPAGIAVIEGICDAAWVKPCKKVDHTVPASDSHLNCGFFIVIGVFISQWRHSGKTDCGWIAAIQRDV